MIENPSGPELGAPENPEQAPHPILEFSDADLAAMLKRAVRLTTLLGVGDFAGTVADDGLADGGAVCGGRGYFCRQHLRVGAVDPA